MSEVTLSIYNVSGEQVVKLTKSLPAGRGQFLEWDCRDTAAGVYVAKITINGKAKGQFKVAIVK